MLDMSGHVCSFSLLLAHYCEGRVTSPSSPVPQRCPLVDRCVAVTNTPRSTEPHSGAGQLLIFVSKGILLCAIARDFSGARCALAVEACLSVCSLR